MVRRQYSGNAHGLIKGIAMVNCLYVNPDSCHYWIVDYRLYDPERDGKTKLDHFKEMLLSLVKTKGLAFDSVLMDSWYVTKYVMLLIEALGKVCVGPLKSDRQVDDSGGTCQYCDVAKLSWSQAELAHGKTVKIKEFLKEHKVKLFRVEVSNSRPDWVVTNDLAQNSTSDTQNVCAIRWKIEQFHKELKQLMGVEKYQFRNAKIQRNHIACAVLVWIKLTRVAREAMTNIYKLKHGMLSEYLRRELRRPSIRMTISSALKFSFLSESYYNSK